MSGAECQHGSSNDEGDLMAADWWEDENFDQRGWDVFHTAWEQVEDVLKSGGLSDENMLQHVPYLVMRGALRECGRFGDPVVGSPIEALFLMAWMPEAVRGELLLEPQVTVGPYRVDFQVMDVRVPHGSGARRRAIGAKLVVECDGHDFHERTKEQAERDKRRDRWLTLNGYTVMRFTGREVWRDPFACVADVVSWFTTQQGDADAED